MQYITRTVFGLFDSSRYFNIPVYQRAYSWEKEQWKALLDDINEQMLGGNDYYLGNILLEVKKKDIEYDIIDGQQRLTTTVILIAALVDVLITKSTQQEDFDRYASARKRLLKGDNTVKVRAVDYDRAYFDILIGQKNVNAPTNSVSQRRIKSAYEYYHQEFSRTIIDKLKGILDKLEQTEVTCIEIDQQKDSALMFELQNNRGKDLTNMEKIKSYLMYRMYNLSNPENTADNVDYLSGLFKQIYVAINDLKLLDEDSVLIYHCQAYINGYSYRNIDHIKDAYNRHKSIHWIKEFTQELHSTFVAIKKLEVCQDPYWLRIKALKRPAFIYPFIIKGYKYFGNNETKLGELFKLIEIACFRYVLIGSKANFEARINDILTSFAGDISTLKQSFINTLNGTYYWSYQRMIQFLESMMYGNPALRYLLWRYEDSLQRQGYLIGSIKITDEQVEHIAPQTPPDCPPEESGYDTLENRQYPENYILTLHSIGNLMLISATHNKAIGNVPFIKKVTSYRDNPLLCQQKEIASFQEGSNDLPRWTKSSIERRGVAIINFCKDEWKIK